MQPPPPAPGSYQHPHWLVNRAMPKEYWDYENSTIEWGSIEPYEVTQKIGRGKYSEVFRGRNRFNGEVCVVKVLKPVKSKKINREITILQNLFGGPNIVRLLDVAMEPRTSTPVLVFENVDNHDFRTLYPRLTPLDVQYYMYQIFRTLDFCHSMGIMHRDIKPHNIMIDHACRKVRVIDWGLGEYYHHNVGYNVRVASRYYKGPELLVGHRMYDYSLDVWSLGCVFAGILFRKEPFFHGKDNADQLVQIVNVLGREDFIRYVRKYNIEISAENEDAARRDRPRKPWATLIPPSNAAMCDANAIDLLDQMLRYDHQTRILPRDALRHPYFDAVRPLVAAAEAASPFDQPRQRLAEAPGEAE